MTSEVVLQALIAAVPAETIDAWMSALPALHPRRLMPALMRSGNGSELCCPHADALRYVEFCLAQLNSTDTTVHNLAVRATIVLSVPTTAIECLLYTTRQALPTTSQKTLLLVPQVILYSKEADERRLLEYLQSAKDNFGKPHYDAQFALRVARQNGRLRACVQLLCELQLHEACRPPWTHPLDGTNLICLQYFTCSIMLQYYELLRDLRGIGCFAGRSGPCSNL